MIATEMDDNPAPLGDSLRDRLDACRQAGLPGLPVPELLRFVAEVASDLDARGRPCGNVKPDTIWIVDGRARLSDDSVVDMLPALGPGTLTGTPAYMAPERWTGELTARSDQYALGCSYAELRIGRLPFSGSDLPTIMRAHLSSPPDLEGCTQAEQRVLRRALAKTADQRFPSCRQLAEQLAQAVATGE
ncbi:MAG: hypothetical protein AB7F89_02650 [Pirellulaceae bacterium]